MGPLSKTWRALESATTAPDDEVDLTIEDLLNLVQQTVLDKLIIPFHIIGSLARWLAKSMIKDKSTLLENSGKELLDFYDQITDTVKAQKHSKELLFNVFQ